jgi:hypothetical protein
MARITMCWVCVALAAMACSPATGQSPASNETARALPPPRTLIIVAGATGEEQFGEQFRASAERWRALAEPQGWQWDQLGLSRSEAASDRELLKQAFEKAVSLSVESELWVVLIGHGTFASNTAKFNLVGPDVSAVEFGEWLKPVRAQCVVINCASSSGPFVTALGGPNRIVLTATRSGMEQNLARFGTYLSEAIHSLAADVDHDQEVSLLEAFLAASSQTERFYREEARLATEHALLDDNGDRVGTGGDFYRGARPAKEPESGKQLDGRSAAKVILFSAPGVPKFTRAQLAERQRIEEQIDALRSRRAQLAEEVFLGQLEPLCIELAKLYQTARATRDE